MEAEQALDNAALAQGLFASDSGNNPPGTASMSAKEVCVVNIGPRERRMRLTFGLVSIGAGAILAVLLVASHAHPLWRLVLFLPFSAGAVGYFQARDKT